MSHRQLLSTIGVILFAQLVFVLDRALSSGFSEPPPLGKYLLVTLTCFGAVAAGLAAYRVRSLPDKPFEHLKQYDWTNVREFGMFMVLVWLQFVILTWAKVMIPVVSPMWADPMLADWDKVLFGADAWRLLPKANAVFSWAYALWPFALFTAIAFAYFKGRWKGLVAFFLTIGILGTIGQYLLPSGGPMFYERLGHGERFADLKIPSGARVISGYLWQAYTQKTTAFGAGISAFPSIHVATAAWMVIATRHWLSVVYYALILLGSVAIGWHYMVDGIAGTLGAIACYGLALSLLPAKSSMGAKEPLGVVPLRGGE